MSQSSRATINIQIPCNPRLPSPACPMSSGDSLQLISVGFINQATYPSPTLSLSFRSHTPSGDKYLLLYCDLIGQPRMINYNSPLSFCLAPVPLLHCGQNIVTGQQTLPKLSEEYERERAREWSGVRLIDSTWRHLLIKPRKDNDNKSNAFKIGFDLFRLLQALEDYAAICFVSPHF